MLEYSSAKLAVLSTWSSDKSVAGDAENARQENAGPDISGQKVQKMG